MIAYLIAGVIALGLVAGLVAGERKAGADKVRAELQPKLTACEGQVSTMSGQIATQNAAVDKLKAEGDAKAATAAKAIAAAEDKAKVWADNAVRLQGVLTNRKPDGPKDCKSAWQEIRK